MNQRFLKTLFHMLDNVENNQIIQWNDQGFEIRDSEKFKNTLLPQYFKHNNYQSLSRQLNKYGFKIKSRTNNSVRYIHETINQNHREVKQQKVKNKNEQFLDYQKEITHLELKLMQMQEGQICLKKQIQISIRIMHHLQKHYENLMKTAISCVQFSHKFSSVYTENQQKLTGNVGGDILNIQFKTFRQIFPEFFQADYITPIHSCRTTPYHLINFLGFSQDQIDQEQ